MERLDGQRFNEQGVYRDPFVDAAGHTTADLDSTSMPKSREATVLLEAVRNRRRPNRFGWHYPEDYNPVGVDKHGNTYSNSEPTHVSGECFRAGSSFFHTSRLALPRLVPSLDGVHPFHVWHQRQQ